MSSKVVELHLHDTHSPLDGLNTAAEYMERANELGMTHLAETNHGTHTGHREFVKEALKAGITPILGEEAYISPTDRFDRRAKAKRDDGTDNYNHIILLANNDTGLETMMRLNRASWEEGFYSKNRIDTDLLESDNEGLTVLSGCLNGLLAKAIERDDVEGAIKIGERYKAFLGDRFFVEVQGSNPEKINKGLLSVADKLDIRPVATSDCHYARKEDLWIEEAFLILSTKPKKNPAFELSKAKKMDVLDRYNYLYPDRKMSFQDIEIFLRDYQTHKDLFEKQGITREDIYENTLLIADGVEKYNLPTGLDLLPHLADDVDAELRKKAYEGLRRRGLDQKQKYIDRLEFELKILHDKNFASYFLVVEDMINWAISQGIFPGPGRGSGAGSLVCYALYITHLDPIEYDLMFERFINKDRAGFPDIDTDFPDDRRAEVKEYLRQKYGYVASIATFNTIGGKSSIKDAARVMGVDVTETNRATKDNEAPEGADFYDHFETTEQSREFSAKHPEVVKLARELSGRIRGTGIHASGVVVSKEPIEKFAPIQTGKETGGDERVPYIGTDMNGAEEIGLIKLDVLGLIALTIVSNAANMIKDRHGVDIDFYKLPMDDPKVYKLIETGYNVGIFQAEGSAMRKWMMDSKCDEFNDLVVGTSVARPGPMNTIGPIYKQRLRVGFDKFNLSPIERSVVGDTLGLPIYQEQIMKYMTEAAGMSGTKADSVRRIIGKKKTDAASVALMEEYEKEFIDGASKVLGVSKSKKLWKDFERWSGYGFNKAHAVAYSMITYWTAWLKVNYPIEFITACLASTGDKDKIANYMIEARRLGITVKLPHINHSQAGVSILDDQILLGLDNIKYISSNIAAKIIKIRPFDSYEDVKAKAAMKGSGVNTRAISSMNQVGALAFEDNPFVMPEADVLYSNLAIPSIPYIGWVDKSRVRTLDEHDGDATQVTFGIVKKVTRKPGYALVDMLDETSSVGIFADKDIPVEVGVTYMFLISNNRIVRHSLVNDEPSQSPLDQYVAGNLPLPGEEEYMPVSFTPRFTKAGKQMANMVVVDWLGELRGVVVFPSAFFLAYDQCRGGVSMKLDLTEKEDRSLIFNGIRK